LDITAINISIEPLFSAISRFALAVILLSLISSAVLLVFEDLFLRKLITRFFTRIWFLIRTRKCSANLDDSKLLNINRHLSGSIFSLPVRQFTGALSSKIQTSLSLGKMNTLVATLGAIGASLCSIQDDSKDNQNGTKKKDDKSTKTIKEDDKSTIFFYADQALDDLQAFLSNSHVAVRILLSFIIALLLGLILIDVQYFYNYIDGPSTTDCPKFKSYCIIAALLIVSSLFTPIIRSLLARITDWSK
jgi:hypothetical protein